jgi:WD40-like Beta Propeller Repeat
MQTLAVVALAFVNWATGTLGVAAAAGGLATPLPAPGLAADVAWSPDGTTLAFTSSADGTSAGHLYVIRPDGTGLRDLTPTFVDTMTAVAPAWSPDGTRLAFLAGPRFTGRGSLDVVDVASGALSVVDPAADTAAAAAWWSPDGGTLAVNEGQDVVTVDVRTGDRHVLAYGSLSPVSDAWSPDGARLAYSRVDGLVSHVVVMHRDGSAPMVVGTGSGPAWSPSGDEVAYTQDVSFAPDEHEYSLWSATVDGSAAAKLTGPFADVYAPAENAAAPQYAGDGRTLLFLRLRRAAVPLVYAANADGTCERPLAGLAANVVALRPGVVDEPVRCVDLHVRAQLPRLLPVRTPTRAAVVVENHGNVAAQDVRVRLSGAEVDAGPVPPRAAVTVRVPVRPRRPGAASFVVEAAGGASAARATIDAVVLPCTILGSDRSDVLHGTRRADAICGRGGNDTIFARDGRRDTVDCGGGRDVAIVDRVDRVTRCERVVRA